MAGAVAASRGNFSISIRISDFDFRKLHFAKAVDQLFFCQISAIIDGRKKEREREESWGGGEGAKLRVAIAKVKSQLQWK